MSMDLVELVVALRASRGFTHKRDISEVVTTLAAALPGGLRDTAVGGADAVPLGDDCAVIPDGNGHLLLAIEGLMEDFVARLPWFAGYSGVMVNLSDIAAMGGRPVAVVDALWSDGHEQGALILQGMAAACAAYGVPLVGGHSNSRAPKGQLAVAVLGRARRLLSSFAARPGQKLLMAVDLRGQWQDPYPFWNASTDAPPGRLRADLALLPQLAEDGLCGAAKDISMAGCLGTLLMMLECSGVGGVVELDALPHPAGLGPGDAPCAASWLRWLNAFPSYGYVLAVDSANVAAVCGRFTQRGIACVPVGTVTAERQMWLQQAGQRALLWDLALHPFIGPRRQPLLEHAA